MANDTETRLHEVIEKFSTSEQSLRSLLEASERLTRVREEVAETKAELQEGLKEGERRIIAAESSLEASQSALMDAASGLYSMNREMTNIARDMKDAAIALRELRPKNIEEQLEKVLHRQNKLQRSNRVQLLVVLLSMAALALLIAANFSSVVALN